MVYSWHCQRPLADRDSTADLNIRIPVRRWFGEDLDCRAERLGVLYPARSSHKGVVMRAWGLIRGFLASEALCWHALCLMLRVRQPEEYQLVQLATTSAGTRVRCFQLTIGRCSARLRAEGRVWPFRVSESGVKLAFDTRSEERN